MERLHIEDDGTLSGYDSLQQARQDARVRPRDDWSFAPNKAYDAYFRMHKVLVGESGGRELEACAEAQEDEWMPRYLNVAGWARAEAALVQGKLPAVERIRFLDKAVESWERAIVAQEQINHDANHEWLREDSISYRLALNVAFVPLMKSLVAGNITDPILERTFADTLAIAQLATVQRHLAHQDGDRDAVGDFVGFGHECNALLTLLFMNDPRHIPLPASARAGSGYDHPEQTHDLVVINQHWGKILKVIPVEIKAKASRRDLQRYNSLIVRGKMHLSVTGRYLPEHTLDAFAAVYGGEATSASRATVDHATSTMCDLLQLYQKGQQLPVSGKGATRTRFYGTEKVAESYGEFLLSRSKEQNILEH